MQKQTRLSFWMALTGVVALALGVSLGAQAKDPIVGTWKLDVAKSTFKPGPAPKSSTLVIDAAGAGIKIAIDSVGPDGTPMKWGWTTQRDGKDAPVTGHPGYDAAATTQTTPLAGSTAYKKGGKTVATASTSISADGKTLTVTGKGLDAKGLAFENVVIYTKQ